MSESTVVSYSVRRALPDDLGAIARIELDSAAYEGRLKPLDFSLGELERLWYDRLLSGQFDVLVAVAGHTVLGFIGIIAPSGKDGFIQAIYIDPDFYHRGIGTALLRASEKIFRSRHCPRVVLYVEPLNHNGKRFYAKAGFVATAKKFRHLYVWVKEIASC